MDALPVTNAVPAYLPQQKGASGYSGGVTAVPAASIPSKSTEPQASARQPATTPEQVTQAVKQINQAFSQKTENLVASYEKDKISGINIVKIVDKESQEVITQLPPEAAVAFAQSLEAPQGWRGQLLQISL